MVNHRFSAVCNLSSTCTRLTARTKLNTRHNHTTAHVRIYYYCSSYVPPACHPSSFFSHSTRKDNSSKDISFGVWIPVLNLRSTTVRSLMYAQSVVFTLWGRGGCVNYSISLIAASYLCPTVRAFLPCLLIQGEGRCTWSIKPFHGSVS